MAKIAVAQENSLNYFLAAAENNSPDLLQNQNLVQVGQLQTELIRAENDFQFTATSEVMLAPYFNSNGHFMEVTTRPSPNAYGYAEPVSNGALYSAQLNIAKNIFNRSQIQNLQFQNKISNRAIELSSEEIRHQLKKQVTTAYIQVY
ncbi:MAG: TolC family protein, partial [Bacteroidota bacterium]|nr:TolC family protein [Bacteroidota bacterium]